jgi:ParB family chromosome partitioning protein
MSKPVNRLGKGLSALIGPRVANTPFRDGPPTSHPQTGRSTSTTTVAETDSATSAKVADGTHVDAPDRLREIAIDKIRPNPKQPRSTFNEASIAELAASIKVSGIVQPLLVRPVGDGFELIAGERRLRAAQKAGLRAVPAIVQELTDAESLEIALVENLQREDLGPLDRATAYQQYIDSFGSSAEQLAARLGESRANVVNYLRLLRLAEEIRELIRSGALGMGQARALLAANTPQRQLALARLAIRRNLSVRQVEEMARTPLDESRQAAASSTAKPLERHLTEVETTLSKSLGLSVTLRPGKAKNSGTILIRYDSLEEFDRVAERLSGKAALD